MLPVEAVREVAFVGVQVVQHHIGVGRAAGCENNDFSEGTQLSDEILAVRSNSDACLCRKECTATVSPPSIGKSSLMV